MRRPWRTWLCVLAIGASSSALTTGAQSSASDKYLGTWTGTWQADDRSGGIEITLEKAKDSSLAGAVSVTGDPTYKATFKSVSFDGATLTAKYDFPPSDEAEVVLAATLDDAAAKGTWTLKEKASGAEVATGTWTASRK